MDSVLAYLPAFNFSGLDSLQYEICDSGSPSLCDTAWVFITVNPVNNTPLAMDDYPSTNEDLPITVNVLLNDFDTDGILVGDSITLLMLPTAGIVVDNQDSTLTYTPTTDTNGLDSLQYEICDSGSPSLCDTAWVFITVNPINDSPVAVNDEDLTIEDTPVTHPVLDDDYDIDGDMITLTAIISQPDSGMALITNDSILYTPNLNFNGLDTLTYSICDVDGLCDTALLIINVGGTNDPPIALDDAAITDEDTPVTVIVPFNDTDPDGDAITITEITTEPTNGTVTIINGDSIIYDPNPDFYGMDTLEYVICDNGVPTLCDTAEVIIIINPINDQPVAVNDTTTTAEDTPVDLALDTNDSDPDGNLDPTSVSLLTLPPAGQGTVTNNADGTITFLPAEDFNGTVDPFDYKICDTGGDCDTATVYIEVTPVNDPPVALDDAEITAEDTPVTVAVQDNDSDPDGEVIMTTEVIDQPINGTATIVNDSIVYDPNPDFYGMDTLTYAICDAGGLCDTAEVFITILPVNDAPIAVDNTDNTAENTPVTHPVLADDSDPDGDPISLAEITSQPTNGTAVITNDSIQYTPNMGFVGIDTLEYRICDNGSPALCDTALFIINVTNMNDVPVANLDRDTTLEDIPVTVMVLPNDTFGADGASTDSITIIQQPANGIAIVNDGGTNNNSSDDQITYTPFPNYHGQDTLIYEICDIDGDCDTAQVMLVIEPVNDPPVAAEDARITNEDSPLSIDVQLNDNDSDGDVITTTEIVLNPTNGMSSIINGDSLVYTPNPDFNGMDTLSYAICDNGVPSLCDTAQVIITVNPINDLPIAVNDTTSTSEDIPVDLMLSANDTDVDGNIDLSSVILINLPPTLQGTVINNGDGSITFQPASDFIGTVDPFDYQICDTGGACDTATVYIDVTPVNDAPIATLDSETTPEDTPIQVAVQDNDSDPDGDAITTTEITSLSTNGTASGLRKKLAAVNILQFLSFVEPFELPF